MTECAPNALSGVKILDFTTLLPGPFATMYLGDFGAEIIKISSPSHFDLVLASDPKIGNGEISANRAWLNRNKQDLTLNLKTPEGVAIIKQLLQEYDVLIEQFRPGVMQKLGLDYQSLRELNPRLIYCSLTGYGQTGPYAGRAGHDINYLSLSGLMDSSGRRDTGPVLWATQVADLAAGSFSAIIGILLALQFRQQTGMGQNVDIAMLDCLMPLHSLSGTGWLTGGSVPGRQTELLNGGAAYDFYETADGKYMSVGALEPKFWETFCTALERPDWIAETVRPTRPDQVERLKEAIQARFKTRTQAEWTAWFTDRDCCVEPVLTLPQAARENVQLQARQVVAEVPMDGQTTVSQFANPIRLSASPAAYRHTGRAVGYDTKRVLAKLGYGEEEQERFRRAGVFD